MDLDDFSRVSDAALHSIERLLEDWFPQGVRDGHEFCIGSLSGEAGKSLRIRLTGAKAGFWSDFSMDGEAGRDLISLYAAKHQLTQGKACAAIAEQLGIALSDSRSIAANSGASRPKPPAAQKSAPAQAGKGVGDISEVRPRSEWVPILPVPDDAGAHPVAHVKRGRPEMTWQYRNQVRQLLGVIYRFKTSDGGKEVLPCVFAEHSRTKKREWRWMQFPEPRPLYLPGPLRPGFPVLCVEGEKCADAAYALLLDAWDVVSWPGGGKAPDKADWSLLAGRTVLLWPDADAKRFKDGHQFAGELVPQADQPGEKTMAKIANLLRDHGCTVQIVDVPAPDAEHGGLPLDQAGHDGWDIADLIAAGADRQAVDAWLAKVRPDPDDMPIDVQGEEGDALPPWVDGPADDAEVPDNVVQLRLVAGSASTPGAAGAGKVTRREVRARMVPGGSPGSVKGCRENVYIALTHDPVLAGLVSLDLFSTLQVKRRMPPWESELGEWTEGDDFLLGMYLFQHYGLVIQSIPDIERGVAQAARENCFNPVIEKFDACAEKWDGVERVREAFATYWGANPSPYMSLISTMFFVGMCKRAYVPGVKHDNAPVFEGGQGSGKSTALSILGGEWFADTPFKMGEKDGYQAIQGVLIYEIAELEQFNRAEVTAVKAFMSSQTDHYREPYGRRMKNQPRRTVFAATTNEGQYFKDATGNRRFWPVETGRIDTDSIRRDLDQLLGEAVHMMRAGVKWYPTPEEQITLITPLQASRDIWDEWTGRVWEFLEGLDSDGQPTMRAGKIMRVTSREILTRALGIEIGKISNAKTETMRVSNIMRKLGWKKERESSGAREWYYVRPQEQQVDPEPDEPDAINQDADPDAGDAIDSGKGYDDLPI